MRVERIECGGYELRAENPDAVAEANRFLETVRLRGLSAATNRAYAYDLLILLRWCAETQQPIAKLTAAAMTGFIAMQRDRNAAPRSINRRLVTCALFYRFVTGHELVPGAGAIVTGAHHRGPGRDWSLGLFRVRRRARRHLRVKTPRKLVDPLTAEQVKEFLRSLRRYRDLAIVYLMLFCGLRSFEVLSIKLGDLDLQQAELRIFGKGNRERLLPLPAPLRLVLNDYLRLERPQTAVTPLLFVVLQGRRPPEPVCPAPSLRSAPFSDSRRLPLRHATRSRTNPLRH